MYKIYYYFNVDDDAVFQHSSSKSVSAELKR